MGEHFYLRPAVFLATSSIAVVRARSHESEVAHKALDQPCPSHAVAVSSAAQPHGIGFDGLPPVRVGMTLTQAEQALHTKFSVQFPNGDGPTGCGIARIEGRVGAPGYMIENSRIVRIDVGGGEKTAVRTVAGIGLGSTIGDIGRAYGTRAKSHPDAYEETNPDFEMKSANGKAAIIFETEHGRVVRIHAGRLPAVEYIEGCL